MLVAVFYSIYALYASGKDAVFGGMIVMMVGYLLYGFIATRFAAPQPAASVLPTLARPAIAAGLLLFVVALVPSTSRAQTVSRIASTRAITIGYVPDQFPFSFTASDRRPEGYALDLCRYVVAALEVRLAVSRIAVNYVPTSAAGGIELIEKGDVDLLCGAITETRKARARVSFSIPIYITGIGALVRKDAPPALLRALNGKVPAHRPHMARDRQRRPFESDVRRVRG